MKHGIKKRFWAILLAAAMVMESTQGLADTVFATEVSAEADGNGELSVEEIPAEELSEEAVTDEAVTGDEAPEEELSDEEVPGEEVTGDEVPAEEIPEEEVPVDDTSSETEAPEGEDGENLTEEETAILHYEGQPTLDDLALISEDEAGAATEWRDPEQVFRLFSLNSEPDWSFDAYYVNQENDSYVEKSRDFQLKYQMEFNTIVDLEAGAVRIRIPASLYVDRYGEGHRPDDIGVPQGTVEAPVQAKTSPFNYYIDGEDLVFFNYRKILAGTNTAFQVLYKNQSAFGIVDETTWELTPAIEVDVPNEEGETETQTMEGRTLSGRVNTAVELDSTSATAFQQPGKKYTPGLYTRKQVEAYLPSGIPEKYKDHFDEYKFVVWDVTNHINGNQAWELYMDIDTCYTAEDGQRYAGEVVGLKSVDRNGSSTSSTVSGGAFDGYFLSGSCQAGSGSFRTSHYVVAAYPRDKIKEDNTVLQLDVHSVLVPLDGQDNNTEKNAQAQWAYKDYHWEYDGGGDMPVGTRKYIGDASAKTGKYEGWTTVYEQVSKDGKDFGDIPFRSTGVCAGYDYTHNVSGEGLGEYIPGTYYQMQASDDVLYAYSLSGSESGKKHVLTDKDYYFSKVTVYWTDTGYDVWEDEESVPESSDASLEIDRGMDVYAMYEGSSEWEKTGSAAWRSDGRISYTFSEEKLARKPWRVKAVHNSVDYSSVCTIKVNVTIRGTSPVFQEYLSAGADSIKLENLSSITAKSFSSEDKEGTWFHETAIEGGNYSEEGLKDLTEQLYGVLSMRDNAFAVFSPIEEEASAVKTAKAYNNTRHERVDLSYSVTAYEGYKIGDSSYISYLKNAGVSGPVRKEAVFYDLLPQGIQFDPSKEVKAGRYGADSAQVSVSVDPEKDIVSDYRETGRMLVIFHVKYTGTDPSVSGAGYWRGGFTLSFGAYCAWEDIGAAQEEPNICAYMPEAGDDIPLIGKDTEVSKDDGTAAGDYAAFGPDINEDQEQDIRNVLFAKASAFEDMAIAAAASIMKTVRADSDRFGEFLDEAAVNPGEGYTYNITVTNTSQNDMKDIVVFDRLENAAVDRKLEEPDKEFDTKTWYGVLEKADMSIPEASGIAPVIYYNESREAAVPTGSQKASEVLALPENGWVEASDWQKEHSLSEVKAVAIDFSRKADGTDYALSSMESISFRLQMTAPPYKEVKNTELVHAYNNASYYALFTGKTEDANVHSTLEGNSAAVTLKVGKDVEAEKHISGAYPEDMAADGFLFSVCTVSSGELVPCASREYVLYQLGSSGEWVRQDGVFATDAAGQFTLKDGQKAVFENAADADTLTIEEMDAAGLYWQREKTVTQTDRTVSHVFTNIYHPPLYITKRLAAVPEDVDTSESRFTFRVLKNGEPLAGQEFYYVDRARTDGSIPNVIKTGTTDKDGSLSLMAGEIAAIPFSAAGDAYQVEESAASYGEGTDWLCQDPDRSGVIGKYGTSEAFTNIYRWKKLYLKKNITHQNLEECTESFSFRIWELQGDSFDADAPESSAVLLRGNPWKLLDEKRQTPDRPVTVTSPNWPNNYPNNMTEEKNFHERTFRDADAIKVTFDSTSRTQDYDYGWYDWICIYDREGKNISGRLEGTSFAGQTYTVQGDYVKIAMHSSSGTTYKGYSATLTPVYNFDTNGVIEDDGVITCRCAGRWICVDGLEAGKSYVVQEINCPADYEMVAGGLTEVKMPVYSQSADVEITNDYRYRGLSVSKTVLAKEDNIINTDIVKEDPVTVNSPNWPNNYPNNMRLATHFHAKTFPGAESIKVTFNNASVTESGYDWIYIYGREGENSKLSGTSFAGQTYTVTGDYVKIAMSSDGSVTKRGYSAILTPVYRGPMVEKIQNDFTVQLWLEDGGTFSPKSGIPYRITSSGVETGNGITDENGCFTIKDGETVVFDKLAYKGTGYKLVETPDEEYPPIYPEANVPIEGVLGNDENQAVFLNGSSECVLLSKEYDAGDGLTEEMISDTEQMSDPSLYTEFLIEKDAGAGWEPVHGEITAVNKTTGEYRSVDIENGILQVDPGFNYVLRILQEGDQYRITETEDYRHRIFHNDKGECWIQSDQSYPAKDSPFVGIVGEDGKAVIRNVLLSMPDENIVYKKMADAASVIPDGAVLTYRIERFDGSLWMPAGDVGYIPLKKDADGEWRAAADRFRYTGSDGIVRLYNDASGTERPTALFKERVWLNLYSGMKAGDLRIVEVAEETDPAFGLLAGYASHNDLTPIPTYDRAPKDSDTFVNSAETIPFRVEKAGNFRSNKKFAIRLQRLVSSVGDNKVYEVGSGVSYQVYNSTTDAWIRDGVVDSNGEIPLAVGEYALLDLPYKTSWSLKELQPYPYVMKNISEINSEQATVNLTEKEAFASILNYKGEISITKDMVSAGVIDAFAGEKVRLNSGNVKVPEYILKDGYAYRVTGIDSWAFYRTAVTSVELPDSVKTIGRDAFSGCNKMTEINIPDGVTEIAGSTFSGCNSLTDITLPDSVTKIGAYAFHNCGFKDVAIPDSVTEIADYAFQYCYNLTDITIPGSVTKIGDRAFYECRSLKEITIPDGVTTIANDTFQNCTSLTDVTILGSVAILGSDDSYYNGAFGGCSSLTNVTILGSVTEIGENAFEKCKSLTDVMILGSVTDIGKSAFSGCSNLQTITILDGVTKIGDYAFEECSSLTDITLSESLTEIGEGAFWGCSSLKKITIPEGWIGKCAFCRSGLTEVEILDGVTEIGEYAFDSCESLKKITIPDSVTTIGANAFIWCSSLTDITIPNSVSTIDTYAFFACDSLTEITIPGSVATMGDNAFSSCDSLKKVTIQDGVTEIGKSAFSGCDSLTEITIPDSVTKIGRYAFDGCSSLTEITIPNSVTYIDESTFASCSSLKKITIPDRVTTIGEWAFYGCSSLTGITIPNSVTEIGANAFKKCSSFTDITIPNSVTTIGSDAFLDCTSLTNITIDNTPDAITGSPWGAPKGASIVKWLR